MVALPKKIYIYIIFGHCHKNDLAHSFSNYYKAGELRLSQNFINLNISSGNLTKNKKNKMKFETAMHITC